MKQWKSIDSWESVSRKAYWDRDVSLEKWKEKVSQSHRSYLPDAVVGMDVTEFMRFYGVQPFIQDWPALRAHLPALVVGKAGLYDLAWSRLVCGGWNLKPCSDFNAMPKRKRQFLISVAQMPGRSIYQVAKSLDMQYRRAHDHARQLMQEGKLRGKTVLEGGHTKTKLYPAYCT